MRDSNEVISEPCRVVLPPSGGPLQATNSTARCLSTVSEAGGKLQAKSYKEGKVSDDMYQVDLTRVGVRRHRLEWARRVTLPRTKGDCADG